MNTDEKHFLRWKIWSQKGLLYNRKRLGFREPHNGIHAQRIEQLEADLRDLELQLNEPCPAHYTDLPEYQIPSDPAPGSQCRWWQHVLKQRQSHPNGG